MKYLKLVETLPAKLEEGVLYYSESDNKIAVKTTPTVEVVDLGLSVNWMTCNIGANKPEEYGKFFQWGDVEGELVKGTTTTRTYNWANAPFNNEASSYDEAYFNEHKSEWLDGDDVLKPQYDAASVATKGVAHMPTKKDFEELTANTTVEWVTNYNDSGVSGRKFTASNGNYIFIPVSGFASNGSVINGGTYGSVWSSSLYSSYPNYAWNLNFISSNMGVNNSNRCLGQCVRGVVSK